MTDNLKVDIPHIKPSKPNIPYGETRGKRKQIRKMKRFLDIFKNNTCKVAISCEKANVGRTTYYDWLRDHEWFAQAIDDAEEKIKDIGENALLKLIKAGNPRAVVFFNETKNKDRGYTKKQTIEHEGEIHQSFAPIKINIIRPNEKGEEKGESKKEEKKEIVDGAKAKS